MIDFRGSCLRVRNVPDPSRKIYIVVEGARHEMSVSWLIRFEVMCMIKCVRELENAYPLEVRHVVLELRVKA